MRLPTSYFINNPRMFNGAIVDLAEKPYILQRPHTLALWDGPNIELKCESVRSLYGVWPLTASMEVKNNYAYNIPQDICNKFIEVKFFVGCMVSRPNRLSYH